MLAQHLAQRRMQQMRPRMVPHRRRPRRRHPPPYPPYRPQQSSAFALTLCANTPCTGFVHAAHLRHHAVVIRPNTTTPHRPPARPSPHRSWSHRAPPRPPRPPSTPARRRHPSPAPAPSPHPPAARVYPSNSVFANSRYTGAADFCDPPFQLARARACSSSFAASNPAISNAMPASRAASTIKSSGIPNVS